MDHVHVFLIFPPDFLRSVEPLLPLVIVDVHNRVVEIVESQMAPLILVLRVCPLSV